MWVCLKLKLNPKGDLCEVSVEHVLEISLCTVLAIPEWANIVTFHPKQPK